LSLRAPTDWIGRAERLSTGINKVKYFRIDHDKIYIGITGEMITYDIIDPMPNYRFEGEAAAVLYYAIKNYFWPYSDFIKKDNYTSQELKELITVHPNLRRFKQIQKIITERFFNDDIPRLSRGQTSLETRDKVLDKKYALYNLIKSMRDEEKNISNIISNLSEKINLLFGFEDDIHDGLEKAFYRAKKVIETPSPKATANMIFRELAPDNHGTENHSYLLLITPSPQ
jgi:hypothetical protein